ncbi:MAG: hypothetical protein MUP58_02315, partial [Candidatus Nanohaloarchaeota archaeon QJJ-9]|nr:hypothetical protein [Candidatus Nanohaloarchaeota archaeon QJJ-9]
MNKKIKSLTLLAFFVIGFSLVSGADELVLNPDRSPVAEFPGNVSLNGNYIQDLGGIADCGPNQYIT